MAVEKKWTRICCAGTAVLFIGFIVMLAMVTVYSGHKGSSSSASNDKPLKGTNSTRYGNMLEESSVNIDTSSCSTFFIADVTLLIGLVRPFCSLVQL